MPSALASTPDKNKPIKFKDANLKNRLLYVLRVHGYINAGVAEITYADAEKVTELTGPDNLSSQGITDLSGLEAFINLKNLIFRAIRLPI